MHIHSFVISEAVKTGWKTTKKYFWIILLLLFVSNLPSMISNAFDSILQYIPGATRMVYSQLQNMEIAEPVGMRSTAVTLLAIISGLVGSRLGLGMIRSYIMMLHGTKPVVKDLGYASWIYVARLIGASFLVGLSVIIGLIALIIPGIFIAARLSMVKYLISEGYEVIDAIKTSRMMTKSNVWNLIGAWIVCFGIVILGVVLLLVGLLWAIPTVSLIHTYIYLELKKNIPTIPAKGHM